jgi:hypothetical protein
MLAWKSRSFAALRMTKHRQTVWNGVAMRMMNEFEAQVLSDLSVLKTQMTGLVGDGNTGRIYEL